MTNLHNASLPKILIVGTLPYDPNESSRALDTYFHNWPKEKLRMIYSNANPPKEGHCSSFYQITDKDVFKNFFRKKKQVGRVFESSNDFSIETKNISKASKSRFLKILKKKNIFRFYLRKMIWNHKRWLSESLIKWIEDFSPEAIYVCFSDDYFILDISLYLSEKFNLPIIVQIGDDYYFKKYNPFMSAYLKKYKKIFDSIMQTNGFGVYISDKLANTYNAYFKKQGFPIYLSSSITTGNNKPSLQFNYFGKTDLGRYESLSLLGKALKQIDSTFQIDVYSNFSSNKIRKKLESNGCVCHESVPYSEVINKMNSGAFNIIASGFRKKDIEATRYSLSTKVADSLLSCGPILAIGPEGDGAIDYLLENKCAIVLTNQIIDIKALRCKIYDSDSLLFISSLAKEVYNKNHCLDLNRSRFESECKKLVKGE